MLDEHRVERLELQVAAHLGPDELHAPDLELGQAWPPGQGGLDLRGRPLPEAVCERQPEDVLAGVAELLDDGSRRSLIVLERRCRIRSTGTGLLEARPGSSVPPVKSMP